MTGGFGSRKRKAIRGRRTKPRKKIGTITWNENIRASATWFRETSPRGTPRKFATKVVASARAASGVYLDFSDAIHKLGESTIRERYGNLFEMYQNITGENPYQTPMRIYPAVHYTMGGLWVDYNLMSNVSGCCTS